MSNVDKDHDGKIIRSTTELSLGPSPSAFAWTAVGPATAAASQYSDADGCRKKRKQCWNDVELRLNDPCPSDWEQCLDLQSGKMYYLDRKTMKTSWRRWNDQNLDLELNTSSPSSSVTSSSASASTANIATRYNNSSGDMVAVACLNCHLLVMLCKSSPSCPNCKFVNLQSLPPRRRRSESGETLSLMR